MAERKQHKYRVGSLVELENGVRMFIKELRRDCDGTNLYNLVATREDLERTDEMFFSCICGIHESYITAIIKEAEEIV